MLTRRYKILFPAILIFLLTHLSIEGQSEERVEDVLQYVSPSKISVSEQEDTEWKDLSSKLRQVLKKADRMVRRKVGYRHDRHYRKLTLSDLYRIHHSIRQLSCSEFVWYVFSVCHFKLGNQHKETKDLAYKKNVYSRAFEKVEDGTIRCGDVLVYEFPLLQIKMEKKRLGILLSGHVVIVFSVEKMIVVGSHGDGSTPSDKRRGVGYRKLLKGWENWTEGRTLKAIYRIKS